MIVGFTGTQIGMTDKQKVRFREKLIELDATEFHHGDCVGADEQADAIARDLGIAPTIHPPVNPKKRAYCDKRGVSKVCEPKEYLDRNKDIVNESDFIIATPKEKTEMIYSGTWSTIRYAKKRSKSGIILLP